MSTGLATGIWGNTATCLEGTFENVDLSPVLFRGESGQQAAMENVFSKSVGLDQGVFLPELFLFCVILCGSEQRQPLPLICYLLEGKWAVSFFFFFSFSSINVARGSYILIKVAVFINIHQTQICFQGQQATGQGRKT